MNDDDPKTSAEREPASADGDAPARTDAAPMRRPSDATHVSPGKSALSVAAGFLANFFLAGLSGEALGRAFPAEFPIGDPPRPTTYGLVLMTLAMGLNAMVAGLLVGRLAPAAPVLHAAILAGLFGMFAMTGMDQAHGLPGWFALSFALVPPAACLAGGVLARFGARKRSAVAPRRGQATAIPPTDGSA